MGFKRFELAKGEVFVATEKGIFQLGEQFDKRAQYYMDHLDDYKKLPGLVDQLVADTHDPVMPEEKPGFWSRSFF